MNEARLVDAVVRAVLAQLRIEEAPCACHSAAGGCCPDRLGRLVGHGAERFGLQAGVNLYPQEIARKIDHTLLKPEATRQQIETLCDEARQHGFATVCVNPSWVPLCARLLRGSPARGGQDGFHRRLLSGRIDRLHPAGLRPGRRLSVRRRLIGRPP